MELKKSNQRKAEKHRKLFFMYGLTLSLSMVFLAFEWSTGEIELKPMDNPFDQIAEWDEVRITRPTPPPPPKIKPAPPKELVIIEVPDESEIEKEVDLNAFVSDNMNYTPPFEIPREEEVIENIPTVNPWELSEVATYPGGENQFVADVQQEIVYPEIARELELEGKIFLSFVVDEKGNIVDVTLLKGVHPTLNNEAIRAIKAVKKKWKPGKQVGQFVRVKKQVPISFRIER